jgi:hypothetical protein
MRLHGTDCASTAPIASAWHRLRRHGTDCVGMAPIAPARHRLRQHGTDCVGMAPIAPAWHRLRRHGTDCAGMAPIASAWHRLRRHGTDCAGTAPGDPPPTQRSTSSPAVAPARNSDETFAFQGVSERGFQPEPHTLRGRAAVVNWKK